MKIKRLSLLMIAIISNLFFTGCVNFSAKNLPQQQYLLMTKDPSIYSVAIPKNVKSKFYADILEIYTPQIISQFSGTSFVYRINEINYISDYYNIFFGFPSMQIGQNGVKYIQASKIFKYASDNILPLEADYVLKTNILELYADYRDKKSPKAVISIQYTLISLKKQPAIIFNKTFSQSITITEKNSIALVDGWNNGLQKILEQMLNWLRSL